MSKKSKTLSRKKINSVLKEVLERVEPAKEDLELIENSLKDFSERFKKKLKSLRIDAEIFVGGSFAKNTVIKKDNYDVDVFVRFDPKYDNREISNLLAKALKPFRNITRVHGSRDYFKLKIGPTFFIELIPVKRIKTLKEAENITDLSYSHVKYINRKVKSSKVLDDIRIAKAFCYANNCYGAESYIQGFSGYALELLVYYYGSFTKLANAVTKMDDKVVIDIEKHFRNKQIALMDINTAKLDSPIVLVDPTYKHRNALAALSEETFERFKSACKKFLKSPSIKSFEIEKIDLEKIKADAKKKKYEFLLIEAKTNKQAGDVAGSKLLKFHRHLSSEIEDFFSVKNKGFNYNNQKAARYFFVVKDKGEIIRAGPYLKDKKHVEKFKKKHKKTFSSKGRVHVKKKINFTLKDFVNTWKTNNRKKLREMDISSLRII
jgi:tRNA CCA-adding enzyme